MKKILWCCLVLAPFHLFAQNIDLQDINQVLHTNDLDSVDRHLQKNGFSRSTPALQVNKQRTVTANTWSFRPGTNPDLMPPTILYKSTDSTGATLQLKTSNPWFYAHLMNQLPELGFEYQQTTVTDNKAVLNFSNGREVLSISITSGLQTQNFQFAIKESSEATAFTPAMPVKRALHVKRMRPNPVKTRTPVTERID